MKKSSIEQDILYLDNHLLILNKHASDIVQGDKTGDEPLSEAVKQFLKMKFNKPGAVFLGVVHRLDRPVSGAVLFARTSKALTRLNAMLRDGEIQKTYWAIVKNLPPRPADHLTSYLVRREEQNKSYIHNREIPGSQRAELAYQLLDSGDRYHLLGIELFTGRHHQIRAQLASIGCPVKGDLKYGAERSNPGGFIHLHARQIRFIHPVRKEVLSITAPVPDDPLWNFFQSRQTSQNPQE